jgi:hypothetical protein
LIPNKGIKTGRTKVRERKQKSKTQIVCVKKREE